MALPLKITLVAALLLLAACRSEPIHFHTLTPAQPGGTPGPAADIEIESLTRAAAGRSSTDRRSPRQQRPGDS